MTRIRLVIGIVGALIGGLVLLQPAYAEDLSPLSEAHVARIKANCLSAQSSIDRLHTNDTLLRVNRGQLYEQLLNKLMTPFNSRVGANNLDNLLIGGVSSDYEKQLDAFRTAYQQYENATSSTLAIDCAKHPEEFYQLVSDARAKREVVHQKTLDLQSSIEKYRVDVGVLSTNLTNQGMIR